MHIKWCGYSIFLMLSTIGLLSRTQERLKDSSFLVNYPFNESLTPSFCVPSKSSVPH